MITDLEIQNFKGISSCQLKNVSRVNLLIGKNDSCKSTIMEAIYYLFKELQFSPQLPEIMSRKFDVSSGGSQLWYKYDTNCQITISVSIFDSFHLEWKVTFKNEPQLNEQVISSDMFGGRARMIPIGAVRYRAQDLAFIGGTVAGRGGPTMISNTQEPAIFKDEITQYAASVSYIDCTLKSRVREIEGILAKFKISPALESRFGSILADIYEKGKEWEFIPQIENPNEKRLAIREAGQLKYFSGFGDGFRSCAGIVGTALGSKDTAIFLEEIESHQHAGSLKKLMKYLVEVARENNLQLFLSTHSKDLWLSLSHGIYLDHPDEEKEEFRAFLIERDSETGKVKAELTDNVQKITEALQ